MFRPAGRRDLASGFLVCAGLAAYVVLVYVAVVLGGGALIGHASTPDVVLSVVAATAVALSFGRAQAFVVRRATALVRGGRPAPYDILRRFSDTAAGTYPAEEIPVRMARLLAEGVGAAWAEVWLSVEGLLTPAATWPADAAAVPAGSGAPDGRRSREVRQAGELLGVLVVQERDGVPLTPVEERLFAGLADQAGLVLRGVALRAELEHRAEELSERAAELRESLVRLVDAQDAERRRLERDIHDGAQQHLVALAVNLRLAQTLLPKAPERADAILAGQDRAVADTIETLADLSRGIYPRRLSEAGLVAAFESVAAKSPVPVRVIGVDVGRFPPGVESAAYFCAMEALQNASKHAQASEVAITVARDDSSLTVTVEDDGVGFDPAVNGPGSGLANMRDRLDAVDGALSVSSVPGRSTVALRIPAGPAGNVTVAPEGHVRLTGVT
jgi:signal transduction histidine kinase